MLAELRDRLRAVPTDDARQMLAIFFAFAAEPVTYEDGDVSTDTVFVRTHFVEDVSQWHPEDTRPALGSVLVTVERIIEIVDPLGDHLDSARASCAIAFPPAARDDLDVHLDVQGPAGDDRREYDFPTLEATEERVRTALARLLERPSVGIRVDGYVPMTPTEASLASPATAPIPLVGDSGQLDLGFAPDDFDRQFQGRKHGRPGSWDTPRMVDLLVEFCGRPLDHGALTITHDEAVAQFFLPDDTDDDDRAQLRLEREIRFRHPDGNDDAERIGCTLLFAVTPEIAALPDWYEIGAPAAAATTPPATPYAVPHLEDLPDALRTSPIALLMHRLADEYQQAASI